MIYDALPGPCITKGALFEDVGPYFELISTPAELARGKIVLALKDGAPADAVAQLQARLDVRRKQFGDTRGDAGAQRFP